MLMSKARISACVVKPKPNTGVDMDAILVSKELIEYASELQEVNAKLITQFLIM